MEMVPINELEKQVVTDFFQRNWKSPEMVTSNGVFRCDELKGFAALNQQGEIVGFITYIIEKDECEIISLDSTVENRGVGSALLDKVEQIAIQNRCRKIKCITTNDNLRALGFYQKRGYVLEKLFVNAVERARKRKPEIPFVADNGIPIRDELLLGKQIFPGK